MNDKYLGPQGPGITFADVLYAVFRHKWKILIISGLGIIAAAVMWWMMPREYQSEAKLFVKYVVDTKSPGQVGATSLNTQDESANAILTEMEILTSMDLAKEVVTNVGAETILGKGGKDVDTAAAVIQRNLIPEAAKGSKVIRVVFKNPDNTIVQRVLKNVIDVYLAHHEEVHRPAGAFDEYLTHQTDELKSRLKDTEEQLRQAKTNAGIISLEDSKKAYSDQITGIQAKITEAEAELAERQATAEEMAKLLHTTTPDLTNQVAHTNEVTAAPEKVAEYKKVCRLLEGLRKREQDLLMQFTPENSWVKQVQEQIQTQEDLKEKLEAANPTLVGVRPETKELSSQDPNSGLRATLFTESAKAKALQAKIGVLTAQLARIQKQAGVIDQAEASITDLQRTRQLQEKNYEYFKQNLEQSKFDQALGAGRNYNISIIQAPSPVFSVSKLPKLMAAVALGAIAFAIGLAMLLEFYFDKSIKRPVEVSSKLGLPLFLSIPKLTWANGHKKNGKASALLPEHAVAHTNGKESNGSPSGAVVKADAVNGSRSNSTELAPWDPRHALRPFCDALRDRLITFFEINNLTHKPKLVAVTSCSPGAGVSTVATSLAASLSETGEGNVLLVNMGEKDGVVQQFHKGDLACGLDEVLEKDNRENALVHDKLYVVSESPTADGLPVPLPRRFKNLVPKLRASDYDYIIFDMPAVSQISITPRLARFMDFVVMVAESEQTNREVLKQACSVLSETKTNVGVVLNKSRNYLPKRLSQDL